jgi:hypothetical protein
MSRLRYLRHLPVASSFEVAELELGEPVVSKVNLPCLQDPDPAFKAETDPDPDPGF